MAMLLYLNREEVMQTIGSRLFRLAVLGGLLLFILGFITSPALALTLSSGRDCDANAVMHCGALTTNELGQKYKGQGLIALYSRFDISSQDMQNIGSTAVAGEVTKSGLVRVDGKTVATNAITAGRQNMPGSTAITTGGVAFYMRPPSVSFASSPLAAFVVMKNNQFDFAIIASCGNPVMATPSVPAKKPAPAAPVTQPAPPPPVVVVTPPPKVISATTPPSAPAVKSQPLPKTGPGNVIGLGALATIGGTLGHYLYQRRRLV